MKRGVTQTLGALREFEQTRQSFYRRDLVSVAEGVDIYICHNDYVLEFACVPARGIYHEIPLLKSVLGDTDVQNKLTSKHIIMTNLDSEGTVGVGFHLKIISRQLIRPEMYLVHYTKIDKRAMESLRRIVQLLSELS